MVEVNHECYVSFEVAELLRQAGFDWKVCTCRYFDNPTKVSHNGSLCSNFNGYAFKHIAISTPTLDVAQRWLREVKNVRVCVDGLFLSRTSNRYVVRWTNLPCTIWKSSTEMFEYNTYEEALEAGIKNSLTLLLKEKK